MSALTVQHESRGGDGWEDLVRLWEESDWPEGCKVEIIEGIITVAPTPANMHNLITAKVQRQLYTVLPDDWDIHQTQSVVVPSRRGLFIPDLLVLPSAVLSESGSDSEHHVPAAVAELVVEVTSPRMPRTTASRKLPDTRRRVFRSTSSSTRSPRAGPPSRCTASRAAASIGSSGPASSGRPSTCPSRSTSNWTRPPSPPRERDRPAPMSSGCPGSHPLVEITRLVLPGPSPTARDAVLLCARLARLCDAGATEVVCDAAAVTDPDLGAVEALARLRLAARGRPLRVAGAPPALRALLELVGLLQLLGEAEEREPPVGVQEGVEPGDPPV